MKDTSSNLCAVGWLTKYSQKFFQSNEKKFDRGLLWYFLWKINGNECNTR